MSFEQKTAWGRSSPAMRSRPAMAPSVMLSPGQSRVNVTVRPARANTSR